MQTNLFWIGFVGCQIPPSTRMPSKSSQKRLVVSGGDNRLTCRLFLGVCSLPSKAADEESRTSSPSYAWLI